MLTPLLIFQLSPLLLLPLYKKFFIFKLHVPNLNHYLYLTVKTNILQQVVLELSDYKQTRAQRTEVLLQRGAFQERMQLLENTLETKQ